MTLLEMINLDETLLSIGDRAIDLMKEAGIADAILCELANKEVRSCQVINLVTTNTNVFFHLRKTIDGHISAAAITGPDAERIGGELAKRFWETGTEKWYTEIIL